jgi:hypothetical protein
MKGFVHPHGNYHCHMIATAPLGGQATNESQRGGLAVAMKNPCGNVCAAKGHQVACTPRTAATVAATRAGEVLHSVHGAVCVHHRPPMRIVGAYGCCSAAAWCARTPHHALYTRRRGVCGLGAPKRAVRCATGESRGANRIREGTRDVSTYLACLTRGAKQACRALRKPPVAP